MNETTTQEMSESEQAFRDWQRQKAEAETAEVETGDGSTTTEVAPPEPNERAAEILSTEEATTEGEATDTSDDAGTTPSTEPTATTTWQDVAAASAEAQRAEPEPEYVTDVLQVKITDSRLATIARENADDDLEKQQLESELETLKEEVKAKKGEIDAIEKRMSERHEAVRTGVQSLKGRWRVVEIFETNTLRYVDPETGLIVHERPMTASERQQDLFSQRSPTQAHAPAADDAFPEATEASDAPANEKSAASDDSTEEAARAEADDDEGSELEEPLDRALAETEPPGEPNDDDTEIDATEILEAATTQVEPQMSQPPSKPTRRGRRGAVEA
jgi:hypothetical protein